MVIIKIQQTSCPDRVIYMPGLFRESGELIVVSKCGNGIEEWCGKEVDLEKWSRSGV